MTIGSLACMGIRPCVHSVLFVPDENDTSYFQIVGKEFTLNFRFMISGSEQQIVPLRKKKTLRHCRNSLRDGRSGVRTLVREIFSVFVHIGREADPASCVKGVLDLFPGRKGVGA